MNTEKEKIKKLIDDSGIKSYYIIVHYTDYGPIELVGIKETAEEAHTEVMNIFDKTRCYGTIMIIHMSEYGVKYSQKVYVNGKCTDNIVFLEGQKPVAI